MGITRSEVNYIAKLSKLKFSDEEAEKLAHEFESILEHFQSIDKFDLDSVTLNSYNPGSQSVVRKDVPQVFEDKKKLFQNAKKMRDTYIEVPKIIE
jgi:aspartyl-tRNA(Asn)/glutamyl-tRNA(Gln) amidotransferase subunit C